MRKPDKTQLITFYSYKGGVGRTMAVANAACQLAIKHGRSVICVDWDLEAPGLHHYFDYSDEELADRPGLLDYLMDFVVQVRRGAKGHVPKLKKYLHKLKPKQNRAIKYGSVRFMHCGRTDAEYRGRVERFNWDEFYASSRGYEIIETLKLQLRAEAEMTLIDARAGQADVGVVPTIQVPDAVVILFASNRQNLVGMERMARSFHGHPQRVQQNLPDPRILLVPSRVFDEEDRFQRWMQGVAEPVYDRLVKDRIVSKVDQPKGLWQCYLAVDPKYSIDECLPVLESSPVPSRLRQSYVELAQALDNLHEGRGQIWSPCRPEAEADWPSTPSKVYQRVPRDVDSLRDELRRATERGDRDRVALVQVHLGRLAVESGRLDEAGPLLQAALAYYREAGDPGGIGLATLTLGDLYRERSELDAARSWYNEALTRAESTGHAALQGLVLLRSGEFCAAEHAVEKASTFYERALGCFRQAGSTGYEVYVLNSLGELHREQGRIGEAWQQHQAALALAEETQDLSTQARTLLHMAALRAIEDRLADACLLTENAYDLTKKAKDPIGQIATTWNIAMIKRRMGHIAEAETMLRNAFQLAKKSGDQAWIEKTREALDSLHKETSPK